MRLLCKVFAVVLLALWPALTSHTLLQKAGLIHVELHDHRDDNIHQDDHYHDKHAGENHDDSSCHEHNADNHNFADGGYTCASAADLLLTACASAEVDLPWATAHLVALGELEADSPRPAPPPDSRLRLLQQSWVFSIRTALPARAPSSLS